jgi:hypothetical protein
MGFVKLACIMLWLKELNRHHSLMHPRLADLQRALTG